MEKIDKGIANKVFSIMMNNAVEAAFFMSICANKINEGTIINPPPTPNNPVRTPTNIPIKINIALELYLVLIEVGRNNEIAAKKITIEKRIIKKLFLEILTNSISGGIIGNKKTVDNPVKRSVGRIKNNVF